MAGGDPKVAEQQSILAEYVYVFSRAFSSFSSLLVLAFDEVIADK